MTRLVAVTGATGYLGSRIVTSLDAAGLGVRRLVRSPSGPDDVRFELGNPIDPELLRNVDVLVHTAYDLKLTKRSEIWRTNVEGTRQLLRAAYHAGVPKIVTLSTMSAYDGTRQLYGRAKLDIERLTLDAGGIPIRPGLVYSDEPAGMAGALLRATRLPLVPLVAGSSRQYAVHRDDLVAAIVALVDAEGVPKQPIGIAAPEPVVFRDLLVALASQEGRSCRFVPVPWQAVYWALRVAEMLPVRLPFRADSLLGLVRPAPSIPGSDTLSALGITFRHLPGARRD